MAVLKKCDPTEQVYTHGVYLSLHSTCVQTQTLRESSSSQICIKQNHPFYQILSVTVSNNIIVLVARLNINADSTKPLHTTKVRYVGP